MGQFGFSYIGALYLLALLAPNLWWARCRPVNYDPSHEDRILLVLERVGQVWVSCAALCFRDLNWRSWEGRSWFLAGTVVLMVLYEVWWVRYFRSGRTMKDFTASLLGVPVAGATLPVAAFFLLGLYGGAVWLLLGDLVLGVGHIGIHLEHRRESEKRRNDR